MQFFDDKQIYEQMLNFRKNQTQYVYVVNALVCMVINKKLND